MTKKPQPHAAESVTITPTVGRDVWFTPAADDPINKREEQPLAAKIAYVHDNGTVNLAVFDSKGNSAGRTSVRLLQEGDERPDGCFAEWPQQKGHPAKAEALDTKSRHDETA